MQKCFLKLRIATKAFQTRIVLLSCYACFEFYTQEGKWQAEAFFQGVKP